MKKSPFISIVVPSFNSAQYIGDTLFSLENQTYRDFEVILSDGGSTDGTLELVRNARLPSLTIDSRPDSGVPDALNRGFALARGEILCWLNSDDLYCTRDALKHVAEAFENTKTGFLFGHMLSLNSCGEITAERYAHLPKAGYHTYGNNIFTGSLFFKRYTWQQFEEFSNEYKYAFEYEIIAHLFNCGQGKILNEFLGAFRIHSEGLSSKLKDAMQDETNKFFINRKRKPYFDIKLERYASQLNQGTLMKSLICKLYSAKKGKQWKSIF